jgi:hypothetical protein
MATVFAARAARGIGSCAKAATKANKASGNKSARKNGFNMCLLEMISGTISLDRVSAYHWHQVAHPWNGIVFVSRGNYRKAFMFQ